MVRQFVAGYKQIFLYAFSMAILIFSLRWLELRMLIFDHDMELYIAIIALLFMGFGIWLAIKLTRPTVKVETKVIEKEIHVAPPQTFEFNEKEMQKLGMSRRELEVLQLMSEGLSNQEIAERLYVSLNTIKTHSTRLYEKLDVRRRTQAVEKGRRMRLIP
jgi:DNA-binding CsgD family transcriptional regulator